MGRRNKKGRNITGIIVIDKPTGRSSNHVLQQVKRLFDAKKAGHTGSLDPLATGVLPICLGEATKVSSYLLDADKRYQVRCQLGVTTDSGDSDGNVVTRLTNNPEGGNYFSSWSPEGKIIAFFTYRFDELNWEIYTVNSDGSGETNLTENPADDRNPSWSN